MEPNRPGGRPSDMTRRDGSPAGQYDYACDACGHAAESVDFSDATGSATCLDCQ